MSELAGAWTTKGAVLYAAFVLLTTFAAIAAVVGLGADGGQLVRMVRLQAVSGPLVLHKTLARG